MKDVNNDIKVEGPNSPFREKVPEIISPGIIGVPIIVRVETLRRGSGPVVSSQW